MAIFKQSYKYKYEERFFLILAVCVALSLWLSHYISDSYFDHVIAPILVSCSTLVAFVGAWLIFRHSEGLRVRKVWGYTLLVWGMVDGVYLVCWFIAPMTVMNMGASQLSTHELLIANLLGWLLLFYPTEALRPRWLTLKNALWQLLPICVLVALDYVVPFDLAPIITLYPLILLTLLISHVRAYKIWCEQHFSALDNIDVRWIMRYLIMIVLIGLVFFYMCIIHHHTRAFTQLWLVLFLFIYGTEQILFRHDPWEMVQQSEKSDLAMHENSHLKSDSSSSSQDSNATLRASLEHWMESEKPYLNSDFRLIDLRQVLPMNRTYLSHFIHAEYGCTFYQFVNHYRIEEAKRLLENPDMKIGEVSAHCGFSSPTVFGRIFHQITGITPREWSKKSTLRKN